MTSIPEESASDNDNERPVREKLKKASLAAFPKAGDEAANDTTTLPDSPTAAVTTAQPETLPTSHTEQKSLGGNGSVIKGKSLQGHEEDAKPVLESQVQPTAADQSQEINLPDDSHKDSSLDEHPKPLAGQDLSQSQHVASQSEPPLHDEKVTGERRSSSSSGEATSKLDEPEGGEKTAKHGDASMEDAKGDLQVPKKKRSRDQFDRDLEKGEEPIKRVASEEHRKVSDDVERPSAATNRASRTSREEPEKKRHRDASSESSPKEEGLKSPIPATSGFANTSAVSPFGALARSKSPDATSTTAPSGTTSKQPETSSSAFAASGFGALANSSTSPFGTIGASSTPNPFGTFAGNKPAGSGFGGLGGTKGEASTTGFGGLTSGGGSMFGSGGSGFGSLAGSRMGGFGGPGSGKSTFGSHSGAGIVGLSEKPAKAFGAPDGGDDEEGEDGNDEGDEEGDEHDEEKGRQASEDRRSQQHQVETGEEGEETIFSAQAKLYHLVRGDTPAESGWRERGAGLLKINVSVTPGDAAVEPTQDESSETSESPDEGAATVAVRRKARLLMRASGVYRVVLNCPVYKGMNLRTPDGSAPSPTKPSKQLMLTIIENGKPIMMQVKFRDPSSALEAYRKVAELEVHL